MCENKKDSPYMHKDCNKIYYPLIITQKIIPKTINALVHACLNVISIHSLQNNLLGEALHL